MLRKIDFDDYDSVRQYAQDLVNLGEAKFNNSSDSFSDFIQCLTKSFLLSQQKLDCLSVLSTDNNPWTLGMTIANYCPQNLEAHFNLLENLLKNGRPKKKIFDYIAMNDQKTKLNFGILLIRNKANIEYDKALALEKYFQILYQLASGGDPTVVFKDLLKLISVQTTINKDSFGSLIASKGDEKSIQMYIEFLQRIAHHENKIPIVEIHKLNDLKNVQDKTFLEILIKNKNVTPFHIHQLLKYHLLSSDQCVLAQNQPGVKELIEKEKVEDFKRKQERFKIFEYGDFEKLANELAYRTNFRADEFKEFIMFLDLSELTTIQKLAIVSIKSNQYGWFLLSKMLKYEITALSTYLSLIDNLIMKGESINEVYNHFCVKTTMDLGEYIANPVAIRLYLDFILKLIISHKETATDYIYKLLLDTPTNRICGLTIGQRLATEGDKVAIQKYLDILIELKKNGKSESDIQELDTIIGSSLGSKSFSDRLLVNTDATTDHFYQLITNKLIRTQQQYEVAILKDGVLELLLSNNDFSDYHIVRCIVQQLINKSGRISAEVLQSVLLALQNSRLSPQEKLDLLSLKSSDRYNPGSTIAHVIKYNQPKLIRDYFELLLSLAKQNVSVTQLGDMLIAKRPGTNKTLIGSVEAFDYFTFIQLLIELKKHGLAINVIHDIFYAAASNDGTSEIRIELAGLYRDKDTGQSLYLILNNNLCSRDIIEKLATNVQRSKESILEYIKSLPSEEKMRALKNATIPTDPEHPLYTFINVKRGFIKTSKKRGVLGLMHEELAIAAERQKNQNDIQSTTANREQDDINFLKALSNSLQTKEQEDTRRLNAGIPLASSNMTTVNNTVFNPNLVPSAPQQSVRIDFRETMQNGYSVDRNVLFAKKNEDQQAKATVTEKILKAVPVVDLISFENEPLESKALLDKNLEKEKPQLIVKEKVKEVAPIKDLIDFDEVPVQLVRNVDKTLQEKTPENMSNKKLSFYARVYPILENTTFKPIPQPDEEIPQLDKEIKTRYVNLVHAKEGQIITKLASSTDDIINLNPIKQQENTQKIEVTEAVVHEPIKTVDVANTEADKSEAIFPAVPNHDPKLFPSINNNVSESEAPKNNEVKEKVKIAQLV